MADKFVKIYPDPATDQVTPDNPWIWNMRTLKAVHIPEPLESPEPQSDSSPKPEASESQSSAE